MPLPTTTGVYIYNGHNCTPNLLPTAQSIAMSPTDPTTVASRLPNPPSTDGQYVLSVTVASGVPTYEWVVPSGGGGLVTAKYNINMNSNDLQIHTAQYTIKE